MLPNLVQIRSRSHNNKHGALCQVTKYIAEKLVDAKNVTIWGQHWEDFVYVLKRERATICPKLVQGEYFLSLYINGFDM